MKKLVSTRQLILIFMISLVTIKVLYFPSLIAKDIGRDGYIFTFLMLLLDYGVLWIFLFLFNKNPDLSFHEMLIKMFGKVVARIIMFFFFLFFILKCFAVFETNFSYLNENLYTSLKWYTFGFPILIALFFMARFGVNSFARLIEVCFPVIVVGFGVSLLIGVSKADYSNLLPVLENGFFENLPVIFRYSFWFGDYTIFIVLFGNIKKEKYFNLKISMSMLATILVITFFIATSYSLFSYNAISHTNSISDMLQVLPLTSDTGSFDWILILIWDGCLFLYFTLNALGAFYTFRRAVFDKWQLVVVGIILTAILVASLATSFDIFVAIKFLKAYACYFCFAVQYILPLLLLCFGFKIKRRKNV